MNRLLLALRIWYGGLPHRCPDPWLRSWRIAGTYLVRRKETK